MVLSSDRTIVFGGGRSAVKEGFENPAASERRGEGMDEVFFAV